MGLTLSDVCGGVQMLKEERSGEHAGTDRAQVLSVPPGSHGPSLLFPL